MSFENVYLVTQRLKTATLDEVRKAEAELGVKFPKGYADFVTKLGEGDYATFVRVYMPERILNEYREVQERWSEYYFWDDGCNIMTKEKVLECIIIADTLNGDEIIFHPSQPDRLLVLPRHEETIFEAGHGLPAAIEWMCQSGELTTPISFAYFESSQNRQSLIFVGPGQFEDAAKAVEALDIHDHLQSETEEEDPFFEMFVADFQGSVSLTADEENVTAIITHDSETTSIALQQLIDCLEKLGLVRQSDDEE